MFGNALVLTQPPVGQNRLDQWGYVLPAFPDVEVCLLGGTAPRPFHKSATVESVVGVYPERKLVVLQPQAGVNVQGTVNLVDFVHPADCIYLFGSDDAHMTADLFAGRTPHAIVYIPTSLDTNLFTAVACAIVLYDRVAKRG